MGQEPALRLFTFLPDVDAVRLSACCRHWVVLQGLLYPLFYLLGGQPGVARDNLSRRSHESHGVKRLLHTTPVRHAIEPHVGYHLGNVNGRMAGCMTVLRSGVQITDVLRSCIPARKPTSGKPTCGNIGLAELLLLSHSGLFRMSDFDIRASGMRPERTAHKRSPP